jgi:hypothetical protein
MLDQPPDQPLDRPIPAADYHAALRAKVDRRRDLTVTAHPLTYRAGTWELLRVASTDIGRDDRVVVVRATIHGDETAGALTLLNDLDDIVDDAHGRGLKLILYPLGNPSGWDRGIRYNADHHMGEGNNDFLRYRLGDGSVVGDLGPGQPFESWSMADDPAVAADLPAESLLMLQLVRQDPLDQVVAALDLHQDLLTEGLGPCAYHYAFGDLARYAGVVAEVARVVPLLANHNIAGGFGERIDASGAVLPHVTGGGMRSDANGFIVRHDGSFSDFYERIGVRHSIAAETSGATPIRDACRVNRIWLRGILHLLAR